MVSKFWLTGKAADTSGRFHPGWSFQNFFIMCVQAFRSHSFHYHPEGFGAVGIIESEHRIFLFTGKIHHRIPVNRGTQVGLAVQGFGPVVIGRIKLSDGRISGNPVGSKALAGCVAVVLSAMFAAYSNVLVKARASNLNPAIIAAVQMLFGLLLLLALSCSPAT